MRPTMSRARIERRPEEMSPMPHMLLSGGARRVLQAALLGALALGAAGCGQRYVTGTKVPFSEPRQHLADQVERYRVALEQRDAEALRTLVSRRYYENGSTTSDPSDDYDFTGLQTVLADLEHSVEAVKYHVDIVDIQVIEETAYVDFEYRAEYRVNVGGDGKWATANDRNRMTFRREDDRWLIVSGL